ncbi:hypothetical protein [uncultured Algibacter sp.]|uniref:hypothetical protein n=1 Tax=uncultured Algibacter sp. TaxID=298659 RepID=UPI00261308DF|nr:hypothetical protein [uncultured Algibacter sp.]
MKRLVLMIFVLFLTVTVGAQTKNDKKAVAEMTEVLSLTEDEAAKILEFKKEVSDAIKNGAERKEVRGVERKKTKDFLGKARFQKWIAYVKAKRAKKE